MVTATLRGYERATTAGMSRRACCSKDSNACRRLLKSLMGMVEAEAGHIAKVRAYGTDLWLLRARRSFGGTGRKMRGGGGRGRESERGRVWREDTMRLRTGCTLRCASISSNLQFCFFCNSRMSLKQQRASRDSPSRATNGCDCGVLPCRRKRGDTADVG